MKPKYWKYEFIAMINYPPYINTNTVKNEKYNHTHLTVTGLNNWKEKYILCKLDIPTDVINYLNEERIVIYYKYRTEGPKLLSYYSNGILYYKIYGTFAKDECYLEILTTQARKLPSNAKLQSPIIIKDNDNYDEKEITYLPAISVYFQSGNLSYIAYIKDGYKYFSPGGQCLLPARIWYYENGSIQREEFWDEGNYLEQFTVTRN